MSSTSSPQTRPIDWVIFVFVPLFFACNIIFGRGIRDEVSPFMTALIRWGGSALIMAPAIYLDWKSCWHFIRNHTWLWLWLGFLCMWICGGVVYWCLNYTSAANATLIYTTSSLFIILLEWRYANRHIGGREILGLTIAFFGVTAIVLRGDMSAITHMQFNIGDFGILVAAVAFAIYSVLLRKPEVRALRQTSLFGLVALSGALTLLPSAAWELFNDGMFPLTISAWSKMSAIILFASLGAFFCFQHTVRVLGPSTAGITLYMTPTFSIIMAMLFLDEGFETYHAIGVVLVLGGVILSTTKSRKTPVPPAL